MNVRMALAVVGGGIVGFAIAAAVYVLVNPMLEDASGWLRETQGLLWDLVPLLTVVGAALGVLLLKRIGSRRS